MVLDAFGNPVLPSQAEYVAWIQYFNGSPLFHYASNPDYQPTVTTGPGVSAVPPYLRFTFDTIGQAIYRAIGHRRLGMRLLWVQGISESGELLEDSVTLTSLHDLPVVPSPGNILHFSDVSLVKPGAAVTGPPGIPPGTTVTETVVNRQGDTIVDAYVVISAGVTSDVPAGSQITFLTSPTTITFAAAF